VPPVLEYVKLKGPLGPFGARLVTTHCEALLLAVSALPAESIATADTSLVRAE
jgi:hypothetical protein